MIFSYGFSVVGKSHIEKGTCCQDSHKIKKLDNGWYIAAIADGVGSAKNSHIGSKIAVDTVVDFCAKYMPWDYSTIGIKSMLRTAYNYAFKKIIIESEKAGEPLESYDTTLTMVIYDGQRIIYGHSGDGAIIGLNIYGDYVQITETQKGPDGVSVLPLRSGYTVWKIDSYEEDLAAVMLMTDGMLDYALCPYLLKQKNGSEIYTPLATYFADPYGFTDNDKENQKIKNEIKSFITANNDYDSDVFYSRLLQIYKKHLGEEAESIVLELKEKKYAVAFMQSVQDDKTMLSLVNTELEFDSKDVEFFVEPNWEELQEEWNKKAYPHLYENDRASSEVSEEKSENPDDKLQTDETIEVLTEENNQSQITDDTKQDINSVIKEFDNIDETQAQNNKNNNTNVRTKKQTYYQPPLNQTTPPPKHAKPKKQDPLSKAVEFFNKMINNE